MVVTSSTPTFHKCLVLLATSINFAKYFAPQLCLFSAGVT